MVQGEHLWSKFFQDGPSNPRMLMGWRYKISGNASFGVPFGRSSFQQEMLGGGGLSWLKCHIHGGRTMVLYWRSPLVSKMEEEPRWPWRTTTFELYVCRQARKAYSRRAAQGDSTLLSYIESVEDVDVETCAVRANSRRRNPRSLIFIVQAAKQYENPSVHAS